MTEDEALEELAKTVPEFRPFNEAFLSSYGSEFPYSAVCEFTRFIESLLDIDPASEVVKRCFAALESLATSEELEIQNLIQVSFCEELGKSAANLIDIALPLMGPQTLGLFRDMEKHFGSLPRHLAL